MGNASRGLGLGRRPPGVGQVDCSTCPRPRLEFWTVRPLTGTSAAQFVLAWVSCSPGLLRVRWSHGWKVPAAAVRGLRGRHKCGSQNSF